jgi:hypothetical protein
MGYMSELSTKKKAEYIWDYYKIPIIAVLLVIIVSIYLIYAQITRINYVFNFTYIGSFMDDAKRVELQNKLTDVVVKDGSKNKKANIEVIPISSGNDNPAYVEKLVAELATGSIDVIVLDNKMFSQYQKSGAFLRLDNIKELNLRKSQYKSSLVFGNNSKAEVYGLSLGKNNKLKQMGIDVENKVIGILSSSKQRDKSLKVLKWILQ